MKNLLQAWYVLRSIALRGPLNSLRLLLAERRNEDFFGIDTMAVKMSDSGDHYHYQGAPYLPLLRILSGVYPHTSGFRFIDLGCGKGRALVAAAHTGYSRITGVELDSPLLEKARENVNQYLSGNTGKECEVRLVNTDALLFDYPRDAAVYFMFNPFSEKILDAVLERILAATKEECWFIYMNPVHAAAFARRGIKPRQRVATGLYTEALIFLREAPGKPGVQASS